MYSLQRQQDKIRTKKLQFIEEDVLNKYRDTLTCGLSLDRINKLGGCNVNKYLAYLALTTSATEEIKDFDIDKCIVVDDFETTLKDQEVDYIDKNNNFKITRCKKDITITHSDGCGMFLPSQTRRKNFMVRLPWVKGLLTPVNFRKFAQDNNVSTIVDIYGKEHNINDVEIIFTKSQFKMHKYYKSWDEYKELFKLHNCTANKCNEEPNKSEFKSSRINYQMLQTLTSLTNDDIALLLKNPLKQFNDVYTDFKTQKKILKNDKAVYSVIEKYPDFMSDECVKETLSNIMQKIKKQALKGKFDIGGKYSFIIPDILAWMDDLFNLEEKHKNYYLQANEIHCSLFKYNTHIDVLRSPHLYREHAIRTNVNIDKEYSNYYKCWGNEYLGVYTSTYDMISKLLQFDVDGDKALLVDNKTILDTAIKDMENILPLYYDMSKAPAQKLCANSLFKGLKSAFKYNNVGKFSNYMTALWGEEEPDMDLLKIFTALNNFSIDAAKTLEMPEINDDDLNLQIKKVKDSPMPKFFENVKDT